jgi:putative aldouronate transport system substrate-binding protein
MLSGIVACGVTTNAPDDERITVRLAAPQNAHIEDFDTNLYKLWLEEQTGLNIEMTWLPAEEAERIAMRALATGEGLPDAFIGFGSSSHDIFSNINLQKYGAAGSIIPLNDLIEQYGVNLKTVWGELAEFSVETFMTFPDGNIYYMPGFSSSPITRYIRQVMWVNKGWLETLDIPVPTTTDEFRDMLVAFKTLDPNGNGLADEIPMAGTEEHYGKHVYDYLFNAFIYNETRHDRLLLENGVVGFAPVRDEWREALKYMRGLYEDGLISPFSFTQGNQQHNEMANDPRDILGAFPSPGITFTVMQNSPEIMERFVGIGPLEGPNGTRLASISTPLPKPNGVITSAAKHPEEVFKLFDLMLSEEASLMGRYGEFNVDWEWAEEGDTSIFGTPATIRIINQIWNKSQNKHISQIGPYISRPRFSGGVTWGGNTVDGEYMNAQAAMLYKDYEPDEYIGELIFTAGEEEHIMRIRTDIDAYISQSIVDFITGQRDIESDNEWAEYLAKFRNLGLETLLETAQTVVDRMNAAVSRL